MVLFIFKIIFLVVFFVGVAIAFFAPMFFPKDTRENLSRKITKIRLIGVIIGATGLLVVVILAGL